jgi:DUF1680 family protein
VETEYPWDGDVKLTMAVETPASFGVNVRLPGWCKAMDVTVDGEPASDGSLKYRKGYLRIARKWTGNEVIRLKLEMPVERIEAHPLVRADAGCVALQRGPVVYCVEEADNPFLLQTAVLPAKAKFKLEHRPRLLGGVTVITTEALVAEKSDWKGKLYRPLETTYEKQTLTAVPYCVWDNRKPGAMRVWLRSQ